MNVLRGVLLSCAALMLMSCSYSMPGTMNGVPDLSGTWALSLASSVSSSPTANLVVSFSQNGQMLSGNLVDISNAASACLPASSAAGTFAISGSVQAPAQAGSNLSLTIMSAPSGSSTSNAIAISGVTNSSYNAVTGTYSFSGPSACSGGTFSMTKQ